MAKKDDPQFRIRLPADLKGKIEDAAKQNGRSLNSEIERRLNFTFTIFGKGFVASPETLEMNVQRAQDSLRIAKAAQKEAIRTNSDPVERSIARYEVKRASEELRLCQEELQEAMSLVDTLSRHSPNRELYWRMIDETRTEEDD